jgi:hypothetical protein
MHGFRRSTFKLYKVQRDDAIIVELVRRGLEFWNNHVVPRVPPPDAPPAKLETLKAIRRVPEKVIALPDDELFMTWDIARAERLACEKKEERAEAELLQALGDAEAGTLPDGSMVTYMETVRRGYTVQESTYRQLRLKRAKGTDENESGI